MAKYTILVDFVEVSKIGGYPVRKPLTFDM